MRRPHVHLLPLGLIVLLLGGLVVGAVPSVQAATTYYVATTGSDTNPGTATAPFRTLGKAALVVKPGDTVNVRAGVYNKIEYLDSIGTASARITFQDDPSDSGRAILDGTGTQNTDPYPDLIHIGGQYIDFKGFEVRNAVKTGISVWGGKYNRIMNNVIHHNGRGGIFIGLGSSCSSTDVTRTIGNEVTGNRVYQNSQVNNPVQDYGGGWPPGVGAGCSTGTRFVDNHIYENYGEGLICYMSNNCYAARNTIYDNFSVGMYIDNSVNVTYERNFIYDTGKTAFYRFGMAAVPFQAANEHYNWSNPNRDVKILNNIAVGGKQSFFHGAYDAGGALINFQIINNTFVNPKQTALVFANYTHTGTVIANNIVSKSNTGNLLEGSTAGISFKHNLWYSASGATPGSGAGTGDVNANPQLVNPVGTTAGDYKLKSTSPAINKGTASGAPTVDYFGAARPQSGGYDLGAHEFGGTVTPSPSPSASPSPSPSGSPSPSPSPSGSCQVVYSKYSDWGTGFSVNLTIKNTGTTPITGWTLGWTFSGNQTISSAWNSYATQSGQSVSLRNGDWNGSIAPGASVTDAGFNGTYSGSNPNPTVFYLNGVRCS